MFNYVDTEWGPSVEGAGPELLAELLPVYEAEIASRVPDPTILHSPGTPRSTAAARLGDVGLSAPEELLAWFEWTSGEPRLAPVRSFPFITPISVDWATANYAALREGDADDAVYLEDLTVEERGWGAPAGWLRLERDNWSVAMHCGGERNAPARMRYATPFFGTTETFGSNEFLSLSTLIAWSIESVRSGATWWAEDRWVSDSKKLPPSQVAAGIVG